MNINTLLDILWGTLIYVLVPTALGSAVAFWFWRKRRMILGNAIGSAVIAVVMIAFILRQFADNVNAASASVQPDAIYVPLLVLVGLGWLDVLIMFFISGAVEDRVKRRIVNPDDF